MRLSQNVELKARLADLAAARRIAQSLETAPSHDLLQTDTYFTCLSGRLKLREINQETSELIWYSRPDETGPKVSNYSRTLVDQPETLRNALHKSIGIETVVDKQRTVYFYKNVRIHLDHVEGLGVFIEFEAVLGGDDSIAQGNQDLEELKRTFSIDDSSLVNVSYRELMLQRSAKS